MEEREVLTEEVEEFMALIGVAVRDEEGNASMGLLSAMLEAVVATSMVSSEPLREWRKNGDRRKARVLTGWHWAGLIGLRPSHILTVVIGPNQIAIAPTTIQNSKFTLTHNIRWNHDSAALDGCKNNIQQNQDFIV